MKRTIRKLLGLALILVLLCSLLPAGRAALAENEPDEPDTPAADTAEEPAGDGTEEPAGEEPEVPKKDEPTHYGVWIGDTEITSANLSGTGWSYTPASNTLKLSNPTIDSYHSLGNTAYLIYASGDLRIEGSASLSASWGGNGCIRCEGDLTLDLGTLTLETFDCWPMNVKGAISMEGGTLKATAQSGAFNAIWGVKGVSISGGTVTAISNSSKAIFGGSVSISGGTVEARGNAGIYAGGDLSISGGSVTAVGSGGSGIQADGSITVGGGVSRLEAQGVVNEENTGAMQTYGDIQIDSGLTWLEPADGGVGTMDVFGAPCTCIRTENGEGEIAEHVVLEPAPYIVNATANPPEGGTVWGAGSFMYGTEIALTATPNTGYHFVNWTTDEGDFVATGNSFTFVVDMNVNFVANFELDTHKVTVDVSPTGGGTVTGDGTFNYGETVTLTATPNTDYEFVNWTENGTVVSTDNPYVFTVESDRDLVANFVKLWTVQFESNGGSAVTEQTVKEGEKAAKPADPTREEYLFDGWYSDKDLTQAYDFEAGVTDNLTLYAKWKEDVKYTVAKGDNAVLTKGESKTLEITVKRSPNDDTCYSHFQKVQIDGKDLVKGTDYTAKAGSTVVTIKSETLNKLTTGTHTVTVVFDDGTVKASVTLKAGGSGGNTTPKTGDGSVTGLWIALTAATPALGAGLWLLARGRKRAAAAGKK